MATVRVIELGYETGAQPRWRLRRIGGVEIRYGDHGPSAIGDWQLDYDAGGAHRLVSVAGRDVRYRIWLGTIKHFGDWRVRYGPVFPLLRQVGPFPVEHRGRWLRATRVGPATLHYEPGTSEPSSVVVQPPARELTDDLLHAVAFTLLEHLWRPSTGG